VRAPTGDAGGEEAGEVAVDAGPHGDRRDVVTTVRCDRDHGAHVDADSGDAAEPTARVRRYHHRPVLRRNDHHQHQPVSLTSPRPTRRATSTHGVPAMLPNNIYTYIKMQE